MGTIRKSQGEARIDGIAGSACRAGWSCGAKTSSTRARWGSSANGSSLTARRLRKSARNSETSESSSSLTIWIVRPRSLLPKLLLSLREILDLPGFTFVLAFDNEIVADGLVTANSAWGDGDSFLDKILDFHYYLPPISKARKAPTTEKHARPIRQVRSPGVDRPHRTPAARQSPQAEATGSRLGVLAAAACEARG